MKCHDPGPPLLFTMIMNAMVTPRITSRDSRRLLSGFAGTEVVASAGVGTVAGFAMSRPPHDERWLHLPYAPGVGFAKCAPRPRGSFSALPLAAAALLHRLLHSPFGEFQQIGLRTQGRHFLPEFQPFVPPAESRPEFTFRALLLGSIFGIIFGAVTVYVGLRAGLTVAASIPIAVLSISILRVLGRASILENNIVQTTGNAGQSIASGVIFTLPALIFLGFDLEYSRIFMLALIGGWLGVLFMIPLRRQLIVKEHGLLPYPEGTACADVLIAGEKGGSLASRVFLGLGLGGVYTFFQNENLFRAWPSSPEFRPDFGPQHVLKGASINADATSEYLGVGYIIGSRVAGVIFAGGVFSWLVVMPLIYFFGKALPQPVYPGQVPIAQMEPSDLWATYIKPMGAGAVAAAGLITLLKTLPTIWSARTMGLIRTKKGPEGVKTKPIRTENDLPMTVVIIGSLLIVACMFLFLEFKPVPGAFVGWAANLSASLLVVVFGFLFVTVSSRIVGLVGSSASPVSGMTIATLMATTAVFLVQGWTAPAFGALAITIGGVVCIAASNSGDTSQDRKSV